MSDLKASKDFDPSALAAEPKTSADTMLAPAQELEQQQWQPYREVETDEPVVSRKKRSKLLRLFMLTLVLLLGAEAGWTLYQAYLRGPIWLGLYSSVIVGALLLLGRLSWREMYRLKQLKRNSQQRQTGARISSSTQNGEAQELLSKLEANLPVQYQTHLDHWHNCKQSHHNDSEQLQLYEINVLRHQDEAAQRCIYRYAAQSSLLLAASPMASLDMALMLWRNQAMLDQVARIYGIEPGYWSRIRLVRKMVNNLLFAGGSQVALDLGAQMLSAELTGKLSARVAQGLGAGLLTARLGYAACAECRPLPYLKQQRPSLLKVQGKLLSELTSISADALNQARAQRNNKADFAPRNDQFTK